MKKDLGSKERGFSLTEALVGLVIFVMVIAAATYSLKFVGKYNANRHVRTKAESAVTDALNDLKVKSGTDNSFFYDKLFSGTSYYVDSVQVDSATYQARLNSGKLAVEAAIGNFDAVTQVRTLTVTAHWRLGPQEYKLERSYNLTAARIAEYGGEIRGKIKNDLVGGDAPRGVGVMVESELGNRWIYSFTDAQGEFFLRGVKIHGPRKMTIFGYSANPYYYFRGDGNLKWTDSTLTRDYTIAENINLNQVFKFNEAYGDVKMVPFGVIRGGVVDGLIPSHKVPSAILQLIPLQTEIPNFYSALPKPYMELLTDNNGEYVFPNMCPGNYRVFMHGSGEDNVTKDAPGDFGNRFSQSPDVRGSYLYKQGILTRALVFEPNISTQTFYAGVAYRGDLSVAADNPIYKNKNDTIGNVIRVLPGETYDSDAPVHNTDAHRHCPDCPLVNRHADLYYSPYNTRFKTTTMMNLTGRVVGVTLYNDGSNPPTYTGNITPIAQFPLRAYSWLQMPYRPNWAGGWIWDTQFFQNSVVCDFNNDYLGRGGFARTNYYFCRSLRTGSDGKFSFSNMGPRCLDYYNMGFLPSENKGLFEANIVKLGVDSDDYDFPGHPLIPAAVLPVFVFQRPNNSTLEQFAVIYDNRIDRYYYPTVFVPDRNVFLNADGANGLVYPGSYGDFGCGQLPYNPPGFPPVYNFVMRDSDVNKRNFDLGDVRVLKKSELVRVTGTIRHTNGSAATEFVNTCNGANPDHTVYRNGTVLAWGYETTWWGEHINFAHRAPVDASMNYDFGKLILPSLPNWDDGNVNQFTDSYSSGNFVDGQWGYGNNRIITYICQNNVPSDCWVDMRLRLQIKKRNGEGDGNFDYYHAADLDSIDAVKLYFLNTEIPSFQVGTAFNSHTATYLTKEDVPKSDPNIVHVVFKVLNLPAKSQWEARSAPKKMLPGVDYNNVDINVDVQSPVVSRNDLWIVRDWSDYPATPAWRVWRNNGGCDELRYDPAAAGGTGQYYLYDIFFSTDFLRMYHTVTANRIAGTVTDPEGKPLPGVTVQLRLTTKDPVNWYSPNSPCEQLKDACPEHDKVTDAAGHFEYTDASELTFGGLDFPNFQIKFKPPASCTTCANPNSLPWVGGMIIDGYDGIDINDADYRFLPKSVSPTLDTGGGGA